MSTANFVIQAPLSYRYDPIISKYPADHSRFSFSPTLRLGREVGFRAKRYPTLTSRKLRGLYRRTVGAVADTLERTR